MKNTVFAILLMSDDRLTEWLEHCEFRFCSLLFVETIITFGQVDLFA